MTEPTLYGESDDVLLRPDVQQSEWAVQVHGEDGRLLLGIRRDGTWMVEPEDAPEAARLFAEAVAGMLT